MARWGRGWEVGINKEIDKQRRTTMLAQRLLRADHEQGKHERKKHEMCPVCHPEQEVF